MQFPQITSDLNITTAVMFKLTEPLLHNRYTIWFDNLCICPDMNTFLDSQRNDCAGALKVNRKNVFSKTATLKRGKIIVQHTYSVNVIKGSNKMTSNYVFHSDKTRPVTTNLGKSTIITLYYRIWYIYWGSTDKKTSCYRCTSMKEIQRICGTWVSSPDY